jgi:uroporphyrin-III C-methyltransferase
VNVVDSPALCTFSLLSVHTDGPLQIGVSTEGSGCALAGRIRRGVVAALPRGLGAACERLGRARRRMIEEDRVACLAVEKGGGEGEDVDVWGAEGDGQERPANFNRLVREGEMAEDAKRDRRVRWLSQLCEYWPLAELTRLSESDIEKLVSESSHLSTAIPHPPGNPPHANPLTPRGAARRGVLILAGAGPGHPDLLTRATHRALQTADLILADKLIPAGILALIPHHTPVHIARKFPGNAARAQAELQDRALAAVQQGKTVLRLKQGDPFVYGRGAEEVQFFARAGYALGQQVHVLGGLTSALTAAAAARIPVTHRGVADQVLICTGTGRAGARVATPDYVPSRTVVFLMALHRIAELVADLTAESDALADDAKRPRTPYPPSTPCAVIERASCPDQRVIRTTLADVVAAVEAEGSRPPGLLVVGLACEVLCPPGAAADGRRWEVEEGCCGGLDGVGVGVAGDALWDVGVGVGVHEETSDMGGEKAADRKESAGIGSCVRTMMHGPDGGVPAGMGARGGVGVGA